ncbi:MAG: MFS transporter [Pseudomonadota bacterium]
MRSIHLPVWLGTIGPRRARTFASLFALMTTCRALLITVVPLSANNLLGSVENVSLFYFGVSLAGLCGSLAAPRFVHFFARRWVFTAGTVMMAASAGLMATQTVSGLIVGMALHVVSITFLDITFNLYLMDHIPREQMGQFEPMRLFYSAGAWTVGPWLGVFLQAEVAAWVPFSVSATAAAVLLVYFWVLRLGDNPAVLPAKRPPPNPIRNLPHFFEQPRLRLAWVLALGRAGWWSMFFIYAPIFCVEAGIDDVMSGAIISIASAAVFIVPLWGWVGRRFGLRKLLIVGYALSGLATLIIPLGTDVAWLGAALLVGAALATSTVDGGGNVPFLRAVHPLERAEMTGVFATYRDTAQLLPPGIFSLLLRFFPLPSIFLAAGSGMLVLAYFSRFLPKRL